MSSRARKSAASSVASCIIILGLIAPLVWGGFNLPIFFVALGLAILAVSLEHPSRKNVEAGLYSFSLMLMLALFFATGQWIWFLIGGVFLMLLSSLLKLMIDLIDGNWQWSIMMSSHARKSAANSVASCIIILGLIASLVWGGFNASVLLIAVALAMLVRSLGTPGWKSLEGGLRWFAGILMLAIALVTGQWLWLLLGGVFATLLVSLFKLIGEMFMKPKSVQRPNTTNPSPAQYYQPPVPASPVPDESIYPAYEEGYQSVSASISQRDAEILQPVDGYDQPQAQYPQMLPPQI